MIELLVEGIKPESHDQPYWSALREHHLVLQRCSDCGRLQYYPRSVCAGCLSSRLDFVGSPGRGVVFSYTVIHRAPLPELATLVPYTLALVDLDEGVRMTANIAGDPADVRIGSPVRVSFLDVTADVTLPIFVLLTDAIG